MGVVDVEAIERAKPKPERDVFHGKSNGGWEINYLDLRGFFFLNVWGYLIFFVACGLGGDSELSIFLQAFGLCLLF